MMNQPQKKRTGATVAVIVAVAVLVMCCSGILVAMLSGSNEPDKGAPLLIVPSSASSSTAPTTGRTTSSRPAPSRSKAAVYAKLTARQWSKIAKSPDSYAGKNYIVYGVVTQFDSATGGSAFRADVDGVRHADRYEYRTNTVINAMTPTDDLVEGDAFRAEVVIMGSYTYKTTLGGEMTVPNLAALKVVRL